ncbi:MAG: pyruvate, phosphate dikinase [Anaerolineae bacterium]
MLYEQRNHKWVYLFNEGNTSMKHLLGGKGANVAEMSNIGLPVPPGLTITTEACNAYYDYSRQFPEGMWTQTQEALLDVEAQSGKRFGDVENPLLLSVRSGASISMPGMMDTVLNLGLNDETVEGLARLTGERRFALDAYRRFISMFGHIVMNVGTENFDRILDRYLNHGRNLQVTDLTEAQLEEIIKTYKRTIFAELHGTEFPQDPHDQLRMAIAAVFDSWMRRRAIDYRRINHIPEDLGTAVNIQTMVFGNLGWNSGTGVAFTRNPSTGEKMIYGEYLLNAQGEDVVAGIRTPKSIDELAREMPLVYAQLQEITHKLEQHYRDMQDIEFTIEDGKLWLLQTRNGKRTGSAAVHIAVRMVEENMITRDEALLRVDTGLLDQLLHPMIDPSHAVQELTIGLPASPGAATGRIVFDPDEAEKYTEEGEQVILVRNETSPEDFHGMVAAQAILTVRGGMTSHAAVVARGMGTPCIVGAGDITLSMEQGVMSVGDVTLRRGDWITVDGSTGRVINGQVPTVEPDLSGDFQTLMRWADETRRLGVRANADNAHDAAIARQFGAQGIGLCRTEHMFFTEDRLELMREMILADDLAGRQAALDKLLPVQRQDFIELFRVMDGLPVTIRLIDPPLHEFLPDYNAIQTELYELKLQVKDAQNFKAIDALLREIWEKEELLRQIDRLREVNPMLGYRGCRLGATFPEITKMQAQAIFEAAYEAHMEGVTVIPEVMIPLVAVDHELAHQREIVQQVAERIIDVNGIDMVYKIGTMIELPRAALTADSIAHHADFFSFGTNDLTQTTFGISRDDSGRFLPTYVKRGILPDDPFQVLDQEGVGALVKLGMEKGKQTRPDLKVGICGEHGGDPKSVDFCHRIGLDYVSCSPYRIPIARLAAAQSALRHRADASEETEQPVNANGRHSVPAQL